MKIVFVSNALDHIQIPLCDAWEKLTDGNFTYVATAAASVKQVTPSTLHLGS